MCHTPLISQVTYVGQDAITQVKDLSCVSHTTDITSNACEPGYYHTGKGFNIANSEYNQHVPQTVTSLEVIPSFSIGIFYSVCWKIVLFLVYMTIIF